MSVKHGSPCLTDAAPRVTECTGGKMKTKEIRFTVPADVHKRLAAEAKREGSSIAVVVRRAIANAQKES